MHSQLNALKAERTDLTRKTKTVEQALESKGVRTTAGAASKSWRRTPFFFLEPKRRRSRLRSPQVLLSRAAAEVEKQKSQLAAEREFLRTELDKSRALNKTLLDKHRGRVGPPSSNFLSPRLALHTSRRSNQPWRRLLLSRVDMSRVCEILSGRSGRRWSCWWR